MLAQSFKTAQELNLTDQQFDALRKTLTLFETDKVRWIDSDDAELTGQITSHLGISFTGFFNMDKWAATYHKCGTVACIGGTAEMIGGVTFSAGSGRKNPELHNLFYPDMVWEWNRIGVKEAAQAIRNYLTRGKPMWETIIAKEFIV